MKHDLLETIKEDCRYYEHEINRGLMYCHYLQVQKAEGQNDLYTLTFDQRELWFGTLTEINAIVKALIKMREIGVS